MPDGPSLPLLPAIVRRPSREAAPIDPRLRRRIVAGIVAGHCVLLLLVDAALRPRDVPRLANESSVTIRWIDVTPPTSSEPAQAVVVPSPANAAPSAPTASRVLPADGAGSADAPAPVVDAVPSAPAVATDAVAVSARLFDPNGRLVLSREVIDAAAAAAEPSFKPPPRAELPPIRSPVPYLPTRFDAAWAPDGETLGDEVMRKLVLEREFKTPWGTRWRCAIVLAFVACGDVPPAPMKNPPKMPWETYIEAPETVRPLD